MDKVRVNKQELMDRLTGNLDTHLNEIKEMNNARIKEFVEYYEGELTHVRDNPTVQPQSKQFPLPESHVGEYNRAIKMVEMSVDDVIELDQHQFDQLVLDNWNWKRGFEIAKSAYLG